MIEPTESENKATLDAFVAAMLQILEDKPEDIKNAPHNAAIRRVDDVQAARVPVLTWKDLPPAKG
jgi:glycine dehydrogenase subunit 2